MNAAAKNRTCLAIVLAAGEGKRMRSDLPKVLHQIAGRSMTGHVLASVSAAGADAIAVIVGPGRTDVADAAKAVVLDAEIFTQTERLGTAHAVLAAEAALARGYDDILIVFADTPLVQPQTFAAMRHALAAGAKVAALGFEAVDPQGYGRLLTQGDELVAIREHKDATDEERQVTMCNAGLMAIAGADALAILKAIGNDNVKFKLMTNVVESPESTLTPEVRAAVMASLDARYPGLPIVPELSSGGTDGMHYRALGMNTVGIGNAAMRSADIFAHGLNERIRVEDFYKGLDHWYLVMKKLAG